MDVLDPGEPQVAAFEDAARRMRVDVASARRRRFAARPEAVVIEVPHEPRQTVIRDLAALVGGSDVAHQVVDAVDPGHGVRS